MAASSGPCAAFTPPALPRPPTFTCAFTTTVPPPSLLGPGPRGVRRLGDDRVEHGDPVLGEQVARLVLEEVHGRSSSPSGATSSSAGHRSRQAEASLDPRGDTPDAPHPGCDEPHTHATPPRCEQRFTPPSFDQPLGASRRPVEVPQSVATFARTQSTIDCVVAPGVKTLATPIASSLRDVVGGDDAAAEHHDVVGVALLQQARRRGRTA
ncbi:hypothetical protein GCM10025868_34440 [Angustibacter aerolatus]|uniref:Uncharacterized protein n=1 Tax=Angustibacter aerolatus TaxID=1162965 RepID=A0ABQ6JLH1_9ACTN|nr:hypothetical protein GCM10025868_34440 [Angustibacter aerolatus]